MEQYPVLMEFQRDLAQPFSVCHDALRLMAVLSVLAVVIQIFNKFQFEVFHGLKFLQI